jgi:hypothetical protein
MRILFLVFFSLLPRAIKADEPKTVTVRPRVIQDVLVNPGIGFMTFQRFNGDELNSELTWTEGHPIERSLPCGHYPFGHARGLEDETGHDGSVLGDEVLERARLGF